jgi:hypothetical protein
VVWVRSTPPQIVLRGLPSLKAVCATAKFCLRVDAMLYLSAWVSRHYSMVATPSCRMR